MKTKTGAELTPETLELALDGMIMEFGRKIEIPEEGAPPPQMLMGAIYALTSLREAFFGPFENQKSN